MHYDIDGSDGRKVLCIGDLHISDVFTGRHKDYLSNCFTVLGQITKKVESEHPACIVLLGDIVGWSETNIRSREVLTMFIRVLMRWNSVCPIFAVRGNHDIKGYPDFNMLCTIDLIKDAVATDGYFSYSANGVEQCRFHLVDYGKEAEPLELSSVGSDIVLGHNNYVIQGLTNWYQSKGGIELGQLKEFNGVEMVISGHIHRPSPQLLSTTMPDGNICQLLYVGCPTRPIAEESNYNTCWYTEFGYDSQTNQTQFYLEPMDLKPYEELFIDDGVVLSEDNEDENAEKMRKEALTDTLKAIMDYQIVTGDYEEQVDNIPNATTKAKEIAKEYIRKAMAS